MAIKITDFGMTSGRTRHTATLWPVPADEEPPALWRVSWLPDQYLTRSEAVTAMVIADLLGDRALPEDSRLYPCVGSFAAELGLSAREAVAMAAEPPDECEGA